jgi:hypothetical protein
MARWGVALGGFGAVFLTAIAVPPADALTNIADWINITGQHGAADWVRSLIPPQPEDHGYVAGAYDGSSDVFEGSYEPALPPEGNLTGWGRVASAVFQNTIARFVFGGLALAILALLLLPLNKRRQA